jgi:hypothetical protein
MFGQLQREFDSPSPESVKQVIELLDRSSNYYRDHNDSFGLARALSERSALLLAAAYSFRLLGPEQAPLTGEELKAGCRGLGERLLEAVCEIERAQVEPDLAPIVDIVKVQAFSNVVNAELYVCLLSSGRDTLTPIDPIDRKLVWQVLKSMEEKGLDRVRPLMGELELLALRLHYSDTGEDRTTAVNALLAALKRTGALDRHLPILTGSCSASFALLLHVHRRSRLPNGMHTARL